MGVGFGRLLFLTLSVVAPPVPARDAPEAGPGRPAWGGAAATLHARSRGTPGTEAGRRAEGWGAWEQVPAGKPRGKRHPETPDWTASPDGLTRTTPARPKGAAYALEEGPYYRTRGQWAAFRLTVEYRALDREPVTPRPPPFPHSNQDWSDSGVYVFDRYEVQILDPSRFDSPADPPGGVPPGGEIRDDPRVRVGGRVLAGNRNRQVPGGVYGVDVPGGRYVNRAHRTGEWNTLVVEFRPPVVAATPPAAIVRAARVRTVLNGEVVFDGEVRGADGAALTGTGARRGRREPIVRGAIYLQSHWGSQVEYRAPRVEALGDAPPVIPADRGLSR